MANDYTFIAVDDNYNRVDYGITCDGIKQLMNSKTWVTALEFGDPNKECHFTFINGNLFEMTKDGKLLINRAKCIAVFNSLFGEHLKLVCDTLQVILFEEKFEDEEYLA